MSRTVLVVDDEPGLRDLLEEFLAGAGFAVRHAGDGQEAQEALTQSAVDLVLTDVEMPRLDGPGLAARLRERGDRTPVVLMSADRPPPEAAGLPFVRKPFDFDDLLAAVARALSDRVPPPVARPPTVSVTPAERTGVDGWSQDVVRETRVRLAALDRTARQSMERTSLAREAISHARQLLIALAHRIERRAGDAGVAGG